MNSMKKYVIDGVCKVIRDTEGCFNVETILQLHENSEALEQTNLSSNWEIQGFNNYNGSLWHIINLPAIEKKEELNILEFTGVDYFTEVWIDDKFIGSHEGYFQTFTFDVTKALNNNNAQLLIVKVTSPKEEPGKVWPDKKQLIKGIFSHHDCRPGGWSHEYGQDKNTGGIWNSINLYTGLKSFINKIKITSSLDKEFDKAILSIDYKILGSTPDNLDIKIVSPDGNELWSEHQIVDITDFPKNSIKVVIENPDLWYPRELGNPNLYTLTIQANECNTITETFGIREVRLDEVQAFFINGKRMFLRGTNIIPTQFLSELNENRIQAIVNLLTEANINIVRVHAHVNRQEFYNALDEAGILVWQDFALQWTYAESEEFRENAISQIEDMVNQFYNHPSIAFWCCHNEPGDQINSLDVHLEEAVKQLDSTRIIRRASNYEEHPYDGWYWGNYEHFNSTPMGPLVTEFGAQALPSLSSLEKTLTKDNVDKLNWDKWKYHNFQYEQTFNVAQVDPGNSIDEFINNSQTYQQNLLKRAIDFYRRKKHNGITGIFQFMFVDCWPSITWSVVDYYLKTKPGYEQLRLSFQPLYISVELRQTKYNPGTSLQLDIWIINDSQKSYEDTALETVIEANTQTVNQNLSIDSDSVKFISHEKINIKIPENLQPAEYTIKFLLKQNEQIISSNCESIKVVDNMTTWS